MINGIPFVTILSLGVTSSFCHSFLFPTSAFSPHHPLLFCWSFSLSLYHSISLYYSVYLSRILTLSLSHFFFLAHPFSQFSSHRCYHPPLAHFLLSLSLFLSLFLLSLTSLPIYSLPSSLSFSLSLPLSLFLLNSSFPLSHHFPIYLLLSPPLSISLLLFL